MGKPQDKGPLHRKVMGHLGDAVKLVQQGRPGTEVEEVLTLVKEFADQHVTTLKPEERTQYELMLQVQLNGVRESMLSRDRFAKVDKAGNRIELFKQYANEFPKHLEQFFRSIKSKGTFSVIKSHDSEFFISYMDFTVAGNPRNHLADIPEPKRMLFVMNAFYRAYLTRVLSMLWTKKERVLIDQVLHPTLVITGFLETGSEVVSPHLLFAKEVVESHGWKEAELNAAFREFSQYLVRDCLDWVDNQSLDNRLNWQRLVEVSLSDKHLTQGSTGKILEQAFQEAIREKKAA